MSNETWLTLMLHRNDTNLHLLCRRCELSKPEPTLWSFDDGYWCFVCYHSHRNNCHAASVQKLRRRWNDFQDAKCLSARAKARQCSHPPPSPHHHPPPSFLTSQIFPNSFSLLTREALFPFMSSSIIQKHGRQARAFIPLGGTDFE